MSAQRIETKKNSWNALQISNLGMSRRLQLYSSKMFNEDLWRSLVFLMDAVILWRQIRKLMDF